MILSLDGDGVFTRNGEELSMELPQSYLPGDVLSVQNGNATILLFSGQEVPLSAVTYYTVPADATTASNALSNMANTSGNRNLLTQTGAAYQIRGKSSVFPMNSKVYNTKQIVLLFKYPKTDSLNLSLKVLNSSTQQVVYEQTSINDSLISLADVEFIPGKSYYWTISNTPSGKPEMGTIVVAKDTNNVDTDTLPKSHFETMNAVSELYTNKFYFEAYAILSKCIETYPGYAIYRNMLENIMNE